MQQGLAWPGDEGEEAAMLIREKSPLCSWLSQDKFVLISERNFAAWSSTKLGMIKVVQMFNQAVLVEGTFKPDMVYH